MAMFSELEKNNSTLDKRYAWQFGLNNRRTKRVFSMVGRS